MGALCPVLLCGWVDMCFTDELVKRTTSRIISELRSEQSLPDMRIFESSLQFTSHYKVQKLVVFCSMRKMTRMKVASSDSVCLFST